MVLDDSKTTNHNKYDVTGIYLTHLILGAASCSRFVSSAYV